MTNRPEYGSCSDCAAWTRYGYDEDGAAGVCRRFPQPVPKDRSEGCWCHVASLALDAFEEVDR